MCTINTKVKLSGNLLNPICIYHPHSISHYVYIIHRYSISQKLSFICTLLSLFFLRKRKKMLMMWRKLKKVLSLKRKDNNSPKSPAIPASSSSLSRLPSPTAQSSKVRFSFSSLFIFVLFFFVLSPLLSKILHL